MRQNFPKNIPTIPLEYIPKILGIITENSISCSLSHKTPSVTLKLDLSPTKYNEFLIQLREMYSEWNGKEIIKCLRQTIKSNQNQEKKELPLNEYDFLGPEQRLLLSESPEFASLFEKSLDKNEFTDLLSSFVKAQKTIRDIDEEEFSLIKRLKADQNSQFYSKEVLILYEKQEKKAVVYHAAKWEEEKQRVLKLLEKNFIFQPEKTIGFLSDLELTTNLEAMRNRLSGKFSRFVSENFKKAKIRFIDEKSGIFALKHFTPQIIAEMRSFLEDYRNNNYSFTLMLSLDQKSLDQLSREINERNWDFSFKTQSFKPSDLLFDFLPENPLFAVTFLGNCADLYKYFKSEPRALFDTELFLLFCGRNHQIDRSVSKLLQEKLVSLDENKAYLFPPLLFIDLSNIAAQNRFTVIHTLLRHCSPLRRTRQNGAVLQPEKEDCESPASKKKGKLESEPSLNGFSTTGTIDYFSTAEKSKEKKVLKDYRAYESEPKETIKKKVFSDALEDDSSDLSNEETKLRDSLDKTTCYKSLQGKKSPGEGKDPKPAIAQRHDTEREVYSVQAPGKIELSKLKGHLESGPQIGLTKVGKTGKTSIVALH